MSDCQHCKKSDAHSFCSGCKCTYYCNQDCQRDDWQKHKKQCKKIRKKIASNKKKSQTSIFSHPKDIEQFESIFRILGKSHLVINSSLASCIKKEISEFSCGEIRECDHDHCESDTEISLLLSEVSNPQLYTKNDILFDYNQNGFFEDDDTLFVYCNQCKNKGHNCRRCHSFSFQSGDKCCRCTRSICEFCGFSCDNPRCKVQYCYYGNASSFTSGCGERFLSDIECFTCEKEYKYCHGCEDKFEEECPQCRKNSRHSENLKKRKKIMKKKGICDISKIKKSCKRCESGSNEEEHDGRVCEGCNIFVCGEHCEKYGRFCRGESECAMFCCNDCVAKGELLNDCQRYECTEVLCSKCKYKCESCWDLLMMQGVEDDEIEQIVRDGNFDDIF